MDLTNFTEIAAALGVLGVKVTRNAGEEKNL